MKRNAVTHELSEYIPDGLDDGVVYVSERFKVAVHKCCCGCGEEVVTPISLTDWRCEISESGISLSPSIGNWSYRCRSHYWIRDGRVVWAGDMSDHAIAISRKVRSENKQAYYLDANSVKARAMYWFRKVYGRFRR